MTTERWWVRRRRASQGTSALGGETGFFAVIEFGLLQQHEGGIF